MRKVGMQVGGKQLSNVNCLLLHTISKKIYDEMYFYLFNKEGTSDSQHKEKLENLLQGVLVKRSISLSSYLDFLQTQI